MACQKPGGRLDFNVLNLFASHINGIQLEFQYSLEHNLTAKIINEINKVLAFIKTYTCMLMLTAWHNFFAAIDICNKVFYARVATLDV